MDGVHDLGGCEGFGPIAVTHEDPAFPEDWEGRMYALSQNVGGADWSIDWFRHMVELLPPQAYLTIPYFEKWCLTALSGMVNSGVFTVEEVLAGSSAKEPAEVPEAHSVEDVLVAVKAKCTDFSRPVADAPRFAPGDPVRTAKHGHAGHTRLPGYARDRVGEVLTSHGAHVLPDAMWRGVEEAKPLYTVRFTAQELWGPDASAADTVMIDLWEPYLEPL